MSDPSAIRYTAFKVIRSNTEIAITPPRIDRLHSNLVHSFITSQAIHKKIQMFKVKGQRSGSRGRRSRSQRKVMYQQQKRDNTAVDRFINFKLGMVCLGRPQHPQVQCIRNRHVF